MSLDLEITSGNLSEANFNLYEEFSQFYSYIQNMPNNIKKKIGIDDDNYQDFFNIYINNPNKSLFKKTESTDQYLIDYWVSSVSGKAKFLDGFLDKTYLGINKLFLTEIYENHIKETNLNSIQDSLLEKGIYLLYENAISGTKVDGVTLKLNGKPVIGMSLRLKSLDSFWFTLLHELSHIVLHYDLLDEPIVDFFDIENDSTMTNVDKLESQANRLAKDIMIPKAIWRTIETTRNEEDLRNYSKLFNIHPSIIAGRIAFEKDEWAKYASIRGKYKVEYQF